MQTGPSPSTKHLLLTRPGEAPAPSLPGPGEAGRGTAACREPPAPRSKGDENPAGSPDRGPVPWGTRFGEAGSPSHLWAEMTPPVTLSYGIIAEEISICCTHARRSGFTRLRREAGGRASAEK